MSEEIAGTRGEGDQEMISAAKPVEDRERSQLASQEPYSASDLKLAAPRIEKLAKSLDRLGLENSSSVLRRLLLTATKGAPVFGSDEYERQQGHRVVAYAGMPDAELLAIAACFLERSEFYANRPLAEHLRRIATQAEGRGA